MSKDYDVGYKKPPADKRFKPGASGNPRGRRPKTLNLKTDLEQELAERIPIREGDRKLKISKQRALLKAMLAKALMGDVRAANVLLHLVARILPPVEEDSAKNERASNEELDMIERFISRRLQANGSQTTEE